MMMHNKRDRSRSPMHRSRSNSPREWKRAERRGMGGGGDREPHGRDNNVRLYVSNLPYDLRWQNIKDLFKDKVGPDVLFAQVYEEPNGKSSGAAIVEVRSREAAMKTIEIMDRFEIGGRKIIVREERDKDRRRHMPFEENMPFEERERGGPEPGMPSFQGNNRVFSLELLQELNIDLKFITSQVFVANLDYKVTKGKLEEVFRIAGNVVDAELKMDKDNKSRGMGIIRFEHPMEAVQAIALFHGQLLYDRPMRVRMDRWIDPIIQDIPKRLPTGLRDLGVGLGMNGQPLLNIGEISNTWILGMLSGQMGNPAMNVVNPLASLLNSNPLGGMGGGGVNMGGMSNLQNQLLGQNSIATLLTALGVGQGGGGGMGGGNLNMGMGGGGGHGGSMQGLNTGLLGPQPMDNYSQSMQQQPMHNNGMNDNYDNKGNGSYSYDRGQSMGFNSGSGSMGQRGQSSENNSIFVKNLPPHFGTQDIYNKFQTCGDIQFVDLKMDKLGRSRGCASITFYNSEAARKTINLMHGARLDTYTLEVRLDRMA